MFESLKTKLITPFCLSLPILTLATFNINAATAFNATSAWQEVEHVLTKQYAYFDRLNNTNTVLNQFKSKALKAKNKAEFNDISQQLMRAFSDPHLNLGPYDKNDFSVFPTGSDIRAIYQNGLFIVQDIKARSAADKSTLTLGSTIIKMDNQPIKPLIASLFGQEFENLSPHQIEYGLNVVLGGLRKQTRAITYKNNKGTHTITLAASYDAINALNDGPTLSYRNLDGLGYIRFNNSLGNNQTAASFKKAINALKHTRALIIDLRNTPSGGNTGVAEPILGHFVTEKTRYQTYRTQTSNMAYQNAPMQTAFVTPTKPHYAKPFIVLAGRWTGSMGEGMTIGLDALGAQTVIGAPMADLLGGIKTVTLEQSDAWLEMAFERLYHVNGSFREDFEPHILVIPTDRDNQGSDPALNKAIEYLQQSTSI
ncbi:Peptidase family S41 [Pseudoalteromonas sp. P1-9]|uniref:S41 family peptidase n=1 Tax=Pseudoalteromonas sp. P1-9 TaxID=1710354 RepID=UPI0006D63A6A|nr:S41 family peptidase [Pseudoalteromonas sp. P1-9]KPV96488.1 Peptidase family S41 [Pseudoalteromonas sp. P1-9]